MKFSTAAASAVLLSNASLTAVNAFGTSIPSYTQRQSSSQQTTTSLSLLPIDPVSVMESAPSIMTASADFVEGLGQLALIGSIGFGVVMGKRENADWSYEYKVGNELSEGEADLALIEESPASVMEKVEEETAAPAPATTPSQRTFFGKEKKAEPEPAKLIPAPPVAVLSVTAEPAKATTPRTFFGKEKKAEPEPAKAKPASVTPEPAKAATPSKELLASAEKAKAAVQKKGVQETKDKMSSKNTSSPPVETKKEESAAVAVASTEVAETKKAGGKRRVAKGVTLIVAAGVVAVARNVVKAYLGRGML